MTMRIKPYNSDELFIGGFSSTLYYQIFSLLLDQSFILLILFSVHLPLQLFLLGKTKESCYYTFDPVIKMDNMPHFCLEFENFQWLAPY